MRYAELVATLQIIFALAVILGLPSWLILQGSGGAELSDALLGIFSVLLGSILALVAQNASAHEAESQRRMAAGYSLYFRVRHICDEAGQICLHIQKDAAETPEGSEKWRYIRPLPWYDRTYANVPAEELALLMRQHQSSFAYEIIELCNLTNVLVQQLEEYNAAKQDWISVSEQEGDVVVKGEYTSYDEALEAKYPVQIGLLHLRAEQLFGTASEGQPHVEAVALRLARVLNACVDDERFSVPDLTAVVPFSLQNPKPTP